MVVAGITGLSGVQLEESKVVSESTKNVTEMVHIITDMTTSLKIITDTTSR